MEVGRSSAIIIGTETEYLIYEVLRARLWTSTDASRRQLLPPEDLQQIILSVPEKYLLHKGAPLNPWANGFILRNGGRLYIDGQFLEYATPECDCALDALTYERAG